MKTGEENGAMRSANLGSYLTQCTQCGGWDSYFISPGHIFPTVNQSNQIHCSLLPSYSKYYMTCVFFSMVSHMSLSGEI